MQNSAWTSHLSQSVGSRAGHLIRKRSSSKSSIRMRTRLGNLIAILGLMRRSPRNYSLMIEMCPKKTKIAKQFLASRIRKPKTQALIQIKSHSEMESSPQIGWTMKSRVRKRRECCMVAIMEVNLDRQKTPTISNLLSWSRKSVQWSFSKIRKIRICRLKNLTYYKITGPGTTEIAHTGKIIDKI